VTDEIWQDHCDECHSLNERRLDRMTGRYEVMFPSACPHKDVCEGRILRCSTKLSPFERTVAALETRMRLSVEEVAAMFDIPTGDLVEHIKAQPPLPRDRWGEIGSAQLAIEYAVQWAEAHGRKLESPGIVPDLTTKSLLNYPQTFEEQWLSMVDPGAL